jgi:hypothetical protein
MSEITGVSITEVTAFGWSKDGQHIWITHKLGDGSEYRLVYPYVASGRLITMLAHATRSASEQRALRNPLEAAEGMDANVIPVEEIRLGTAPENAGVILHLTTADNVPIAVEFPVALLQELIDQAQRLLKSLQGTAFQKGQMH